MNIAVWIILGPLTTAIMILLLRRWSAVLALLGSGVSLASALITLDRVWDGKRSAATFGGLPGMPLQLAVDPVSALVSTTVATVATLVLLYAIGYMAEEQDQPRFFTIMALFVTAMQSLVLAGDWILLLAAWELIGIASYLLISFWFDRPETGPAATRAFIVTRAADVGLYIGVIAIIASTETTAIAASQENVSGTVATIAGLGFLVAIVGKSAQVPLQGWLLDAMAGPTPVSALLHAATLVVAGVILMTRAFPFLPAEMLLAMGLAGGVSSVVTGVIAAAQGDFKRLLAASTSSQLGLMFLALGAGSVPAALLHLVTHAAMKSALFLGAGIFQHARESTGFDELGGIGRQRKGTFAAVTIAGLALAGVPPLAGFWSKDSIIAASMESAVPALLVPLALAGSLLTGVYVARALRLLWNGPGDRREGANDEPIVGLPWMTTGLASLTVLTAILGVAVNPVGGLLGTQPSHDLVSLLLGLIAAGIGLLAGWSVPAPRLLGSVYGFASEGFRFNGGLDGLIADPLLTIGNRCDHWDRCIHRRVLDFGQATFQMSRQAFRLDARIHRGVEGAGRAAVRTAAVSRLTDEDHIDVLIARLVNGIRCLGSEARQLQSGLVHRELLFALGGAAVITILILILSLDVLL